MRISVELQRKIVRHVSEYSLSNRKIGVALGTSPNTVKHVRERLVASGMCWQSLMDLSDISFSQTLGTAIVANPTPHKMVPDWAYIAAELKKRDVTLELLWQEFRESNPDGVSYSHMARLFRSWLKKQRVSMRQIHRAGEKFFVDFCGKTMPITDRDTGMVSYVQIFVGVLGASSYIFAWAVPSQQVHDWISCHIEAFKHFGGVPQQVIPDNLKSAVLKHGKDKILFNKAYFELAEHYDFIILPARPRKPKDKGMAEVSVRIVQQGVLAKLRNQKFFSVEELNQAIQPLVATINAKTTHRFPKSRLNQFIDLDQPVLQHLPERAFEICDWKYQVKVSEFYSVEWQGHYYSVPYQYAHQLVDLRMTAHTIEVIFQRQRIASHVLSNKVGEPTVDPEHMPPNHRFQRDNNPEFLLEWSKNIGSNTYEFARRNLTEQRDIANGLKRIQKLKRWVNEQNCSDRLESACEYALQINAHTVDRLQSIIKSGSDRRGEVSRHSQVLLAQHSNLRGSGYFKTQGEASC